VELGGLAVGWVQAGEVHSLESDPWAEIRGLVVTGHHRGHGLGRALVEAAAEWGRARGLTLLRLRTNVRQTETHGFYERLGFEVRKTQLALARPL
jgi:GNAT superfamily N-acetyltransferase